MRCQSADYEVLQPYLGGRTFLFEAERSVLMVLIKVQYDAYNRQFKLVDGESTHTLVDGENYLLIAEVSTKDLNLTPADNIQTAAGIEHVMA
jgi:hypothetical protein